MEKILEWVNSNPWLNLLFLILALLSLLTSIILFFRGRREKKPCYRVKSFRLIRDNVAQIEAVEILYQGQKIENLTLSKVAIWNRGRDPIDKNDIAPLDPIRIKISHQFKLLGAEITHFTNQANNSSITPNFEDDAVEIQFDYFGKDEGVVIQLYHTGTGKDDIKVHGTIKGIVNFETPSTNPDYILDTTFEYLLGPFGRRIGGVANKPLKNLLSGLLVVMMIPIFMILAPILMVISIVTKPMRRIPESFHLN